MSVEIVAVQGATGGMPGTLVDQQYPLPPGLPFAEWEQAGLSLRFVSRNINWWLGDWLLYGKANYDEDAYQATCNELTALLGREADSLSQCMWVASRFPPADRVKDLSWSHHRAVLIDGIDMNNARALLAEAADPDNAWSVTLLSEQAKARRLAIDADVRAASENGDGNDKTDSDQDKDAWVPTEDDLTPEAWQAAALYARQVNMKPKTAGRAWAIALHWAGVESAFTRWQS